MLLQEARWRGNVIVYLLHPYEFAEATDLRQMKRLHRAYRADRARRYADTIALLEYMLSAPDVQAMTASECVDAFA